LFDFSHQQGFPKNERFEVLTASTKMAVLWDVAPCSLVGVGQRFRGPYCHPDDRGSKLLLSQYLTDYMVLHPRRQSYSSRTMSLRLLFRRTNCLPYKKTARWRCIPYKPNDYVARKGTSESHSIPTLTSALSRT
jgi:hypothetical protein